MKKWLILIGIFIVILVPNALAFVGHSASQITSGTFSSPTSYSFNQLKINGLLNVTAGNIVVSGNNVCDASNNCGYLASVPDQSNMHTHDMANITSGNLGIARMPSGGTWSLSSLLGILGANVGIGIANPIAALHVVGNSYFNGDVNITGTLYGASPVKIGGGLNVTSGVVDLPASSIASSDVNFNYAGSSSKGGAATSATTAASASDLVCTDCIGSTEINDAQMQVRVSGTCAAGSSIRVISSTGTVTCETDNTGGTLDCTTVTCSGAPCTATCASGYKVTGGSMSLTSANYPSGNGWYCNCGVGCTCTAICCRVI